MEKDNTKKKDFWKSKGFLFGILPLFIVGVLATGYVVNHFSIKSDVYEPLSVQYNIIGDHGNYNGQDLCSNVTEWSYMENGDTLDVDGLFAGESRKFCVKIANEGEGDISYAILSKIISEDNYKNCSIAFPEISKNGVVSGLDEIITGAVINVPDNAPIVNDCIIEISVSRG